MSCAALLVYSSAVATPAENFAPVLLGGAGSLAVGGYVAWRMSRPVANVWRRASLAMMGVTGTAFIDILTVPAHLAAGRWGLAALGGLCVATIIVARRIFAAPSA